VQTGIIFDVKQYALHDGPGIRTTIFLKGCPLTCWWCHNPEGIGKEAQVLYTQRRCIACGECLDVCRQQALSLKPEGVITDESLCQSDGACAEICPAEARELVGQTVTPEAIWDIVKKDIPFYEQSGGGVTFSGGEPLMQPEFLLACLKRCGRGGLHRAVDTSGHAELDVLKAIAGETDLFLYDLKFMDPEKHKRFTGVSNQLILTNLKYLARSGAPVTVRLPLIPGVNDDQKNLDLMGMFLRVLPEVESVHILPYHNYQENKYARLNTEYQATDIPLPTADELSRAKKRLESFNLKVEMGG
jgi:pyruvate formate lyase activating enzyme